MPLAEACMHKVLKEGSGLVTASFPQSGFLQEHRNIGKQTLLTMSVFLWTDRLWEGLSRELRVSCLLPINTTALHAAVPLQPACLDVPGSTLPTRQASYLPGKIILCCVQPEDRFCQPLVITGVCAPLSQTETSAERTVFSWRPDWQQWGKEPSHREGLQQVYQQAGRHFGLYLGLFATFSSFCCSPVCFCVCWSLSAHRDLALHLQSLVTQNNTNKMCLNVVSVEWSSIYSTPAVILVFFSPSAWNLGEW